MTFVKKMCSVSMVEMLRTMTLQERMAFDAEEQQKLESESTKLKGEMMVSGGYSVCVLFCLIFLFVNS